MINISTQTTQQKRDAYAAFLQQMVAQGLQPLVDDVHNYTTITNWIEAAGLSVAHDSMVKAINANSQQLHWAPSQAEQHAAKAHEAEVNRLVDEFCSAHDSFVKCDENLNLIIKFCREQHHGTIGSVQLEHFWRIYQDSSELVRRATNTQAETPESMWARQNLNQHNPARDREERLAAAAEKTKQFQSDVQSAKTRATCLGEMKSALQWREMSPLGVNWAKTYSVRVERLTALLQKYPAYAAEIQAQISKAR